MLSRNPVLLIHGIDDTTRLFGRMLRLLEENGWEAHSFDLIPNDGTAGIEKLAEQLAGFVLKQWPAGQPFDMLGFSVGGLGARYYVQRLDRTHRVKRLVTISSPHAGTWVAWLRQNEGVRQMRPCNPLLRSLNDHVEWLQRVKVTSFWTAFDLMILPATSSVLAGARSVRWGVAAHPLMMRDKNVLAAVMRALEEGD